MSSRPAAISYALNLDPALPDDVQIIARRQGEDPDRVCADLEEFKDMIYERGDFVPIRMDNAFLIKFLRARFFKHDKAYKLLKNYTRLRQHNPELHDNINPMRLISLGEDDVVSVAPFKDQHQRRIMFYKIGKWQPARMSINDILAATLLLLELGSLEPVSQVLGGIGIFDFDAYSMSQVWHINPSVVQKIIALMVTSVPQRTCEIHIVNHGWVFDVMFQMFKPFMSDRMRANIHFHGADVTSLHRFVPPEHLPAKYGGMMPDISCSSWIDSLTKSEQIISELETFGYKFEQKDLQF